MTSIQVLVSTMNLSSATELYGKMNLCSDALIINQCDSVGYKEERLEGKLIQCYSLNDRGLSKSRNNALMRCSGDIVCFADDDMRYSDTYALDITEEFLKHPEADAIVFNVEAEGGSRNPKLIRSFRKVGKAESRMYGSVHVAARRKELLRKNIYFNIQFGTGSVYSCGEDTLFLKEMIDKGLKLYKSPVTIGKVDMSESTWFEGYTEKYYCDKGALIAASYPRIAVPLALFQSIRNSKRNHGTFRSFYWVYKGYREGIRRYSSDDVSISGDSR